MSKPKAGAFYVVVAGDQIRSIARKSYGYDRSSDIIDSNIDLLKDRAVSLEGLPTIYKGDRLWLPEVKKQFSEKVPASTDDEIAIRIDGKVFKGWTSNNIERNINTIADAFAFTLPYDSTDLDLREKTKPFSYKPCDLFIGGELYIAAQSIKWATAIRANETIKTIDARTKAGHTIECMAQKTALEFNNQTLAQIATEIMKSYGDDLKPIFLDGDSDIFPKVRKEITDTDFSFLSGLATQKGFMITSSDTGQMAFIRAAVDSKPLFRFVEGITAVEHIGATFDGMKRFSTYQAITESAGSSGPSSSIQDESIPVYRPLAYSADDLESGNLDTSLQWRRAKSLADSTSISTTVTGWRNENGQLWRENMKGTVLWSSIDILTESEYIISSAKFGKSENGGNVASLSMVLPQSYTLDFPKSFPWDG